MNKVCIITPKLEKWSIALIQLLFFSPIEYTFLTWISNKNELLYQVCSIYSMYTNIKD